MTGHGVPSADPAPLGMGDLLVELADTLGATDCDGADKSGLRAEILRRTQAAQVIVDAVKRAADVADPYDDDGPHVASVVDALAAAVAQNAGAAEQVVAEAQARVEREADARREVERLADVLRAGLGDALAGRAPQDPMGLAAAMLAGLDDPADELAPLRAVLAWGASGVVPGTRTDGTGEGKR